MSNAAGAVDNILSNSNNNAQSMMTQAMALFASWGGAVIDAPDVSLSDAPGAPSIPSMRQILLRPTHSRLMIIPSNQFMTTRKTAVCAYDARKVDARFQTPTISTSAISMTAQNGIMKRLPRRMTSPCSARPRRWASSIYAVG